MEIFVRSFARSFVRSFFHYGSARVFVLPYYTHKLLITLKTFEGPSSEDLIIFVAFISQLQIEEMDATVDDRLCRSHTVVYSVSSTRIVVSPLSDTYDK